MQRPDWPRININAPLASNLLFAGLGGGASSLLMADASGWGKHGTLTNMDPGTDWIFDSYLGRWVLDFAGSDEYTLLSPVGTARYQFTKAFSVSLWASVDYMDQYDYIVGTGDYQGRGWRMWTRDVGLPRKFAWECYDSAARTITSTTIHSTAWTHLCGIHDGTTAYLYVNGKSEGTPAACGDVVYTSGTTVPLAAMGAGSNDSPSDTFRRFLNGRISDLLIYNRVLALPEIQQLADPSNVMLSGLILPPTRKLWPAAVAGEGGTSLVVPSSECVVQSPEIALTQHHVLAVPGSQCVVESPEVALVQHHVLTGASSECVVTSPEVALVQHHVLSVPSSECVVESPTIDLVYHHVLEIPASECVVTSPNISWTTPTFRPMQFMVC